MSRAVAATAPLRVSVIVPDIGGSGGGAGTTLPTVACGLGELGVDVELVTIRATSTQLAAYATIPTRVLLASRQALSIPAIVRYLRDHRPDVVLTGPGPMNVMVLAAAAIARTSAKVVISEHGNLSLDTRVEYAKSPKLKLMPLLMKMLYRRADGIVAPTRAPLDDPLFVRSVSLGSMPRAIIPNPLRWRALEYSLRPLDHPWLAEKSNRAIPVAVSVGRLAEQKGYDSLILAVSKLNVSGPKLRLLILGEGPKRAALEELIVETGQSECVALIGHVDNPLPYIRGADVFVLSSRWESFGNVLVEAMSCGTPVVSTNAPTGPAQIISDGVNGRLVPVEDVSALGQAIVEVVSNQALATRLCTGGLVRSLEYSATASAGRYIAFFEEVCKQSQANHHREAVRQDTCSA